MKRGPKPIPTALKELHGNPGHRPLNDREPKPPPAIPDPPDHLGAEALIEWERVTAELHAVGLITHLDRATLAAFCVAYGRWVTSERMVREKGMMLLCKRSGQLYPNPYLVAANRALEQMGRFGSLLGLSPSARTGLRATPPIPEGETVTGFARRRDGP